MSFEHLQEWFHAAAEKELLTSTWGFILPRVFEALAAGCDPNYCGVEVSLDKFQMGNPKRWKPREWEVIQCFQKTYLKNRSPSGDVTLDEALCMFACAGWRVEELFEQVLAWSDEDLIASLWDNWHRHWLGMLSIEASAFWPKDQSPLQLYADQLLYNRMVQIGMDPAVSSELSNKALDIADAIYCGPRNWKDDLGNCSLE